VTARPPPIGNIWCASSVLWFLSFALVLVFYWPALDELGYDPSWLSNLLWPWLLGTAALWIIGLRWTETQRRSLMITAIGTLFGLLLFTVTCILIGFAYFILMPDAGFQTAMMRFVLIIVLVWWCVREVRSYRTRIADSHFLEREFIVEDDHIVLRRPPKTSLDPAPIGDKTFLGKIYHRFGPYVIMLVPMAYPLQRVFADTGGVMSVALLISILGAPLTIHAIGRLTCGAYLYVYKVWQLERRHGKPVVFEEA
jgi:hypothetical protein